MRTSLRLLVASIACVMGSAAVAQDYRARLPEDEVIYFLLPDRFENGDASNDKGGLQRRPARDRLRSDAQGLFPRRRPQGADQAARLHPGYGRHRDLAFAPIFKNKPVQGPKGQESAGYHGYWVTDFTTVDPHLGTDADFKAFVDAAHARGMKVYMDIIANHTADVIQSEGMRRARRNAAIAASPTIRISDAAALSGAAINRASTARRTSPS